MSAEWTPDAIQAALPTSDARQTFLRELNLCPINALPKLCQRWVRYIEEVREGVARGIELRGYMDAHGGALPEHFVDATDLIQSYRAA